MTLSRLDIANFRNLVSVKLEPIQSGFNFIYGENGSGKTSLLEAIYYLSLGRSFRTSLMSRIINHEGIKFSLFAQIMLSSGQFVPLGIERSCESESKTRVFEKDVTSISELARLMPLLLMNSNCYHLLDGPIFRRKYMDWGLFYSCDEFLIIWKQFNRILKQRNAALRTETMENELKVWTSEFIAIAEKFNQIRQEYVMTLIPILKETLAAVLPIENLKIVYYPGWSGDFAADLAAHYEKDMQLGYTQLGPHRADLKLSINNIPVRDVLSRGQQKIFSSAMLLAQGKALLEHTNKKVIYLVDDLPSELDETSKVKLLGLLAKQETQVFITAIEPQMLNFIEEPIKMFHVEHGSVIN